MSQRKSKAAGDGAVRVGLGAGRVFEAAVASDDPLAWGPICTYLQAEHFSFHATLDVIQVLGRGAA